MTETERLVGSNLRAIREHRGLKQSEMAEIAGISASFLGMVERGERGLSLSTFAKVCDILKVSPADVLRKDMGKEYRGDDSLRENGRNSSFSRLEAYAKALSSEEIELLVTIAKGLGRISRGKNPDDDSSDKNFHY